jgi:hypothetical protein
MSGVPPSCRYRCSSYPSQVGVEILLDEFVACHRYHLITLYTLCSFLYLPLGSTSIHSLFRILTAMGWETDRAVSTSCLVMKSYPPTTITRMPHSGQNPLSRPQSDVRKGNLKALSLTSSGLQH